MLCNRVHCTRRGTTASWMSCLSSLCSTFFTSLSSVKKEEGIMMMPLMVRCKEEHQTILLLSQSVSESVSFPHFALSCVWTVKKGWSLVFHSLHCLSLHRVFRESCRVLVPDLASCYLASCFWCCCFSSSFLLSKEHSSSTLGNCIVSCSQRK